MTMFHLNGHHRRTLDSIFRQPTSHNVEWHDLLSLLNNVGAADEHPSGRVEITVENKQVILAKTHGKDVAAGELRRLRLFFDKLGINPASAHAEGVPVIYSKPAPQFWIVLVDHRCAKLFAIGDCSHPAAVPLVVVPEDAHGYLRHLERRSQADHGGGRVPEDNRYYERIASDLQPGARIAILSDGKGKSSAGKYLLAYLDSHHADIASRIVTIEQVDLSYLSNGEIVEIGRGLLQAITPLEDRAFCPGDAAHAR